MSDHDDIISMQSSEGMSESTALALIPKMFSGCTWEQVDQATYAAWMKENGPKI